MSTSNFKKKKSRARETRAKTIANDRGTLPRREDFNVPSSPSKRERESVFRVNGHYRSKFFGGWRASVVLEASIRRKFEEYKHTGSLRRRRNGRSAQFGCASNYLPSLLGSPFSAKTKNAYGRKRACRSKWRSQAWRDRDLASYSHIVLFFVDCFFFFFFQSEIRFLEREFVIKWFFKN